MSSKSVCHDCGCGEIDIDSARGDAVCTNCGAVLEENAIVAEVQFEDNARGGSSAIGQFVGADGKIRGKPVAGFNCGLGTESRENTLRKAKQRITEIAQQLRLNQHCIDTAFNFFKMALSRRLTCGRLTSNVVASCLYITCRTEGTPHLLIDFSDVTQVDVFELGRTFSRLATALCINLPLLDPCLYILRFAHKLQFGEKTQDVTTTALRLVQRMKRDWLHTGRRPSGLCGAALLISGRLHGFHRTVDDVVKVARVNKATLKKRLVEFGETPSSSLTLDEFMSVDLEEEQDPPAFKVARRKDKERLQKALEDSDVTYEFTLLQRQIENMLERRKNKIKTLEETLVEAEAIDFMILPENEDSNTAGRFLLKETSEIIEQCVSNTVQEVEPESISPLVTCGFAQTQSTTTDGDQLKEDSGDCGKDDGLLDLTDIDDKEIESYIMSQKEIERKTKLWIKLNEDFLQEQKEKQERLEKEISEGKHQKKKKYTKRTNRNFQSNTPAEAIEKMLREKRISSKINYDVLKNLNKNDEEPAEDQEAHADSTIVPVPEEGMEDHEQDTKKRKIDDVDYPKRARTSRKKVAPNQKTMESSIRNNKETLLPDNTAPTVESEVSESVPTVTKPIEPPVVPDSVSKDTEEDLNEELEDDEVEEEDGELSVAQLLSQHRGDGDYNEYGDEEEDFYSY